MLNPVQLKPLVNFIHRLHLLELKTSWSPEKGVPVIEDWCLQGNVDCGWTLTIPADGVLPFGATILKLIGFQLSDDEIFFLTTGPGETVWSLEAESFSREMELLPDELLKRGTADVEMADILMGRKEGFLPADLIHLV